ncbi:MAG: hypothetical protein PHE73_03805 [Sulfurovaceae bacterium]|nr:hypothetical protein [Sulfurovaceae bacterium]
MSFLDKFRKTTVGKDFTSFYNSGLMLPPIPDDDIQSLANHAINVALIVFATKKIMDCIKNGNCPSFFPDVSPERKKYLHKMQILLLKRINMYKKPSSKKCYRPRNFSYDRIKNIPY